MFFDTMFSLLVLCRVLIIAGVQTLTIDSQLGTSIEDCFERISIGEQLPPTAIYRNVSELTSRECEHICKQDKQCQVYDYGVGAKGNATCNLSMLDEKEVKEKNLLSRHPDYDVYVRRVLCEQTPPKPIQVLQDDPGPNQGPQHRPVFRPDPEDRPLNEDYLISSNIGYKKPQNPYRPDDPSNPGLEYDFPPSYGQHKPQNIPYKPTRPNDKYRPQKPIDQNDQLHFQGYGLQRPDPLNDYHAYKPDRPSYYRPNRRPQDNYRPDGPIGPPDRPNRPNRPYKPGFDYNNQYASNFDHSNQYASNYGQNNQNDVYVEIYDPPRPYVPIKDRPHQDYGPGYLGYGTYSSQNSYTGTITEIGYGQNKPIYNRPHNDRPQKPDYSQINNDQGYQKPQINLPSNSGSNQDYNRPTNDYGGYGYQKPSYNKPSYQNDYNYYDHNQSGYENKPADGYRPQKPNRPYGGSQYGYGSQGSYGSGQNGYGGGQNSYGNSQSSYGSYDSYNQGDYGSYGTSQYGSPYGQNYGSSYGYHNDYSYNRPGYGNDDLYNKPYQKPKPIFDYQKPGYNSPKPDYDYQKPQKPGYGDQNASYDNKPGYGITKPTYDDKPDYNDQTTGYGGQKPGYNDQTTGDGNQKPGYSDQTTGYGNQKPGYIDQTGYGNQKPGYNDQTTGYGNQKPGYSDLTTGYGNQKPDYNDQTSGYGTQKPGYSDLTTGYGDQTGYNANKPSYSVPTTGYGNQKPSYEANKPGYNQKPSKPAYIPSYNDDGYQNQKPVVNYSDTNRPDVRPVYEYDLEKPGNVPSYIVRPGGEVVTSHPVVIGDYGKHPGYKEPVRISYKGKFFNFLKLSISYLFFVRKLRKKTF